MKKSGRHKVEVYLFTPHDSNLSAWNLSEQQFLLTSLEHRFGLLGLLGLPDKDRVSKTDRSFLLLSPYYEISYGSWLFQ